MTQERLTAEHPEAIELINSTLYWDTRMCSVCDRTHCIPLAPTAARFLTYLLQHANQFVAAKQLKAVGWLDQPCSDADLYKQIHVLRGALQDTTPPYHCLQTRYGYGYLLHCDRSALH